MIGAILELIWKVNHEASIEYNCINYDLDYNLDVYVVIS